MGLYLDNGYADIPGILNRGMTFNFCIGGRGTGKTYGALRHVLNTGIKFILMRKTQSQLDSIARPDTNPFKSPVRDLGVDWYCDPVTAGKNIYAYRRTKLDADGKPIYGDTLGYAIALSTIANLRGFDMSDADIIIFDEFISEAHERAIKNESDAFFNAYETINRNRELQGKKPVQVLALANSNDFACPILVGLDLVTVVERMITRGQTEYVNPQRSVGIFLLTDSPISNRKGKTALYKLTAGSGFADMAIKNAFAGADDPDVYSVNLNEYKPIVQISELCVYRHKFSSAYYVSSHVSGSVPKFSGDGVDMKRFFATHKSILMAAITSSITYETHLAKALFLRYCNLL